MWNILSRSVAGTSHKATEVPCQDFCDFREVLICGIPCLIAAIADGAGSAAYSQYGAEKAVFSALNAIASSTKSPDTFEKTDAEDWFRIANKTLSDVAVELNCTPKELSCTLLLACITPNSACFAQIGDGGWVALSEGKLQAVTWPNSGEYANETVFLTSKNYLEQIKFNTVNSLEAFSGFTDGLQLLALDYAKEIPYEGFFNPLIESVKNADDIDDLKVPFYSFLDSEMVNNRTDDDKTLFIAVKR